ncbi:beta-ketoacyl synthase N-terminal-like domain-containing protein [Kitasatospora sp. NPDC001540]|uniref:type I polyketide synthase n=1 Tax=Kitasatospora sp. NPDC001540 TaxID=3364014 RepID=UPI0036C4DFC5
MEAKVTGREVEAIAVVGAACRFPGRAATLDGYWKLLLEGGESVGPVPEERWADYAGRGPAQDRVLASATRSGSFLAGDIYGFDAPFFGIAPREARLMDPQQRMALEVAWQALEHAGIDPQALAGGDAGVFMGVGSDDYGRPLLEDLAGIEAWTGIGASLCGVANRISHTLDLRGPSMAVDTACSSSLVALHQACLSLRAGECPLALAGGVMLMTGPGLTVVLDRAGALAPDGRSKPFDAAADGYGRGEGCGVVVLKRLSDAVRDRDEVLALIRGSAVHQDGRTEGIMAPSGSAQEHLLRRAYAAAGVDPAEVDYVEAHGTGTRAGDPLEARALAAVLGPGRAGSGPCLVGAVKGNIGHLEAAAGIAGLIKAVLVLRNRTVPPNQVFSGPTDAIDWEASGLRLVTGRTALAPRDGRPLRAGVASYGYGGTIAHVVLEEAPHRRAAAPDGPAAPAAQEPRVYPLSAGSPAALQVHARELAEALSRPTAELADIGHTMALRRAHLPCRAAVVADDRATLVAGLRAVADPDGPGTPGAVIADAPAAQAQDAVWVFSGHGSQWVGMGRELLVQEPVFARTIDRLGPWYQEEIGFTPRQVIEDGSLDGVDRIQATLVAVQLGLAELWRWYGLRPGAVIGHSVGEISAAVVAGVLTEEEGARLVCRRSALLRAFDGLGAMAMVTLPSEEVARDLKGCEDISCAVEASPTTTVVSGTAEAVERWCGQWERAGHGVRPVKSTVAFHSPQMEVPARRLEQALTDLSPRAPRLPLYATACDDPRSAPPRDSAYWARNLREPVRFAGAVRAAAEDGHRTFLEVSPHPVVAGSITETAPVDGTVVLPTLRRGRGERAVLLSSLAALYCQGARVDWERLHPHSRLTRLPGTVWERAHHRAGPSAAPERSCARYHDPQAHTLLGEVTAVHHPPLRLWRTVLERDSRPYPGAHPVAGTEIVPAAVLLHTFAHAARELGDGDAFPDLIDVDLRIPVAVPHEGARELQVLGQAGRLTLSSRLLDDSGQADTEAWQHHCSATVATTSANASTAASGTRDCAAPALPAVPANQALPRDWVVRQLSDLGVAAMGFPWHIISLHRGEGVLLARARAVPEGDEFPASWASLLDAALSLASLVFGGAPLLRMPAHLDRLSLTAPAPTEARIEVHRRPDSPDTADVRLTGTDGPASAELHGLRYAPLEDPEQDAATLVAADVGWLPVNVPAAPVPPRVSRVLLVGDRQLEDELRHHWSPTEALLETSTDLRPEQSARADHVLVARTVDGLPTAQAAHEAAAAFSRHLRALLGPGQPPGGPRIWCLTRGVREAEGSAALARSPLWGMSRVAAGEHPDRWGGTIDLPASALTDADASTVLRLLTARPTEDILCLREGGVQARRLLPSGRSARPRPAACQSDATYAVTGGLGALGLLTAATLTAQGARRLLLLSRSGLPPRDTWDRAEPGSPLQRRIRAVRALEAEGATVLAPAVDVADETALQRLLRRLELPPVRGVVHAAGTVESAMLQHLDEAALGRVMRPKVDGALALHRLFPPGELDFMVFYSSLGPLLGLPGQGSYAAANSFLDALARHRNTGGHHETVSVAWTSWRGQGMSTSAAATDAELAARGTADITAAQALRHLPHLLSAPTVPAAADFAVLALKPQAADLRPPLLGALPLPTDDLQAPAPQADPLAGLDGAELEHAITAEVRRAAARVLGGEPDALPDNRPLSQLGMDSLLTVRFRVQLEQRLHTPMPATLVWNHPTVAAIARYAAGQLARSDSNAP